MDAVVQIAIGVAASLIAASVIALFPRIMLATGRGSRDISGRWDYFTHEIGRDDQDARPRSGTVNVRQWGSRVWLSLVLDKRRDGSDYGPGKERRFALKGRWSQDEMFLHFVDERARHQSGVMGIHWRGGELVGRTMYVEGDRYQASSATDTSDWLTVHGVRLARPTTRAD